jgi:hypothetical protein
MFAKTTSSSNYNHVRNYSYSESSSSSSDGEDDFRHHPDKEDFIQREIRQQRMLMRQQDEGLEMLGESATRLSQISLGIHEELGQQMK